MRQHLKDRVAQVLLAAILVLVLLEALLFHHYHPVFPWHHVPGYAAAIGFLGCVVVVQLSKWLGKKFLQQPEEE